MLLAGLLRVRRRAYLLAVLIGVFCVWVWASTHRLQRLQELVFDEPSDEQSLMVGVEQSVLNKLQYHQRPGEGSALLPDLWCSLPSRVATSYSNHLARPGFPRVVLPAPFGPPQPPAVYCRRLPGPWRQGRCGGGGSGWSRRAAGGDQLRCRLL